MGICSRTLGGVQGVGTITYMMAGSIAACADPGASTLGTAYEWYA
jgi:hypothetical protein